MILVDGNFLPMLILQLIAMLEDSFPVAARRRKGTSSKIKEKFS